MSSAKNNGPVVIRPAENQPDLKEYQHLTEKQRMNAGYPYKPADPELGKDRAFARALTAKFNSLPPEAEADRKQILKQLLNPNTAEDVFIEPSFRCDYGYNITIGEGAQFNFDCCFLDCAPIKIGKRILVAPGVHFYAATHPVCGIQRRDFELARPITIGDDVWIGGMAIICPGVTIGNNVTVGAGAVVTKDIPSNVVVAGNPAKIIRYLPGYEEKK